MEKIDNFDKVEANGGSGDRLAVGAYVCLIGGVTDHPDNATKVGDDANKSYIELLFDICEGKYVKYFENAQKKFGGNYGGVVRRYYGNAKSQSFFKGFTTSVEKSNAGYKWNWDEKTLVGKKVVIVFREEEYVNKANEVKTAIRPYMFRSIEDLKAGKVEIPTEVYTLEKQHKQRPEPKPVEGSKNLDKIDIKDDDLPF